MGFSEMGFPAVFRIFTIILGVLLAAFVLLFGVANLINPDVPEGYLDQNTRVCIMLIITGLMTIFAMFRPFFGGILLGIFGVIFFILVTRNPVALPVILLSILFVICGRLKR